MAHSLAARVQTAKHPATDPRQLRALGPLPPRASVGPSPIEGPPPGSRPETLQREASGGAVLGDHPGDAYRLARGLEAGDEESTGGAQRQRSGRSPQLSDTGDEAPVPAGDAPAL